MRVIGITGGVGSGKSEVLRHLKEKYQAVVCQLDEVAKELQMQGGICYQKILGQFGTGILSENGELDRQKLSSIIFQDEEKREILNGIVHPEVKRWVTQDILEKKEQKVPLYVIEAALLPEAGYEDICPELWYIYAREDVRRKRLKASRGYTDERISRMMAAQSGEDVFRSVCRTVIDNSGTFEATKKQIGEKI